MTRTIMFAMFTIAVLLSGTLAMQLGGYQFADAVKSKGNPISEIGSNKVCGDRLCSEVKQTEEKSKEQDKKKEHQKHDEKQMKEYKEKSTQEQKDKKMHEEKHMDAKSAKPEFLFVQTSTSGSFTKSDRGYSLILNEVTEQTLYFSDRPNRIVGHQSTEDFVNEWNQGKDSFADDPPNAAISVLNADISQDTVVVELTNPTFDSEANTLMYSASILSGNGGKYFTQNDGMIPETFDEVSVFIDLSGGAHLCVWKVCISGGAGIN